MIGVFNNSLPGFETHTPTQTLDAAKALGLDAVMFGNILTISPTLDHTLLGQVASEAAERRLKLAAGIGSFNPSRPDRAKALVDAGYGDMTTGLGNALRAAKALGVPSLFFVVGMIEDRDDPDLPWQTQLDSVIAGLKAVAPVVRETGVKLLIKTHEEITTFEILRIIDAVGADVLGVAHDPVNVVCRIEDAVEATRRIAPHIAQVHVDNCYQTFDGDLMRRYLCPMTDGDLDWPAILKLSGDVMWWVEFHRGQFAMPIFDRAWVAAQSDITLDEYRGLVAGTVKRARENAAVPDQVDVFKRLAPAIAWLRDHQG